MKDLKIDPILVSITFWASVVRCSDQNHPVPLINRKVVNMNRYWGIFFVPSERYMKPWLKMWKITSSESLLNYQRLKNDIYKEEKLINWYFPHLWAIKKMQRKKTLVISMYLFWQVTEICNWIALTAKQRKIVIDYQEQPSKPAEKF